MVPQVQLLPPRGTTVEDSHFRNCSAVPPTTKVITVREKRLFVQISYKYSAFIMFLTIYSPLLHMYSPCFQLCKLVELISKASLLYSSVVSEFLVSLLKCDKRRTDLTFSYLDLFSLSSLDDGSYVREIPFKI